jgi:tRNA C32,U32 (ribose-2'-O)-methylase TrmJ
MKRLLIAGIALAVLAGAVIVPQPARALENCSVVTATADARNRNISIERAENRLHHYIARNLRSLTGKTVSPVTTNCIRNACKSQAIVCHH